MGNWSHYARFGFVAAGVAISASACQTLEPTPGVPALLSNPSAQTTDSLSRVVSEALNGRTVTLAADILTKTPQLVVELAGRSSLGGVIDGRRMDRPDHFALSISNEKCVLTHQETGLSYFVPGAQCKTIT